MSMKLLLFLMVFAGSSVACASGRLVAGSDLGEMTIEEATLLGHKGDFVVIGEEHGQSGSREGQMRILQALRDRGFRVSVAMEFFEYPQQPTVDVFRAGQMTEPDFLRAIQWGNGFSFDFYRDQVLFPQVNNGEKTLAINMPRSLTSQVARGGLDSLSAEQKLLLPPNLEKGNPRYFARFKEAMGSHLPSDPIVVERYFWAQSIWDDTMAWKSIEAMKQDPNQVIVIIVGEFHSRYGGGLPHRLNQRGAERVWTFSQVNIAGMSEDERDQQLVPHPWDGKRADFLWIFD